MVSAAVASLPAAVSGSIIYADLWGELSTHLAPKTLFAQSSPVQEPLLQAFSFPSTLGKVTLHPRCQAYVFIYSSCVRWVFPYLLWSFPPTATFTSFLAPDYWAVLLLLPAAMFAYSSRGKWVFPPLLWSFPPSATLTSFPPPGCWAPVLPLPPEPLRPTWLVYLQSREGFPSPNLQRSGCPTLFPTCLYCSYCLLLSFSFFPQVGVSLSRGLCCSGPGLSVGILRYHEAHLVHVFPSHLGVGDWRPPGFSV
jgi:hypothetical protein